MKKNKLMLLTSIILLATGCVPKPDNEDSETQQTSSSIVESKVESSSTTSEEESLVQEEDIIGLLPTDVLNYKGEIDILTYVEGQNGTITDIGSSKYTASDLFDPELARFAGAARAFKKLAPGVKINVIYCSISEYNDRINAYNEKKGHLPHIMHPVDSFYEMLEKGFVTDLSCYTDSEYYQSLSPNLTKDMTWGNFVVAFPTHYAPYGMFVNKNILKNKFIVDPTNEDEYQEWIDNLTFEEYIDVCERTYETGVNAGFTKMFEVMSSYMYEDAYYTYYTDEDHNINLTTDAIRELVENEARLEEYSVYEYVDGVGTIKEDFPDVKSWSIAYDFVDGFFTFNTEMPWSIGTISQYATAAEKTYNDFDYMPYPKASEDSDTIYGNAVGGLSIGNLCPIGDDGQEHCYSSTAKLEQDVAAYFSLFMIADPRAISEQATIEYTNTDGDKYTGYVTLPMSKKDFRFSYQDDDVILSKLGGDPTEGYDTTFAYQLALYLKTYPIYYDTTKNGGEPDVVNYSNISYGLMKIINAITDDTGTYKVANYAHIPANVDDGGVVVNILDDWTSRYTTYGLGSETYVANLTDKLSDIQNKVNENVETAYDYMQEMVDMFYIEGYTVK